ncbi:phage shock protein A [Aeromicrobium flavum]|uniref:Phage shock protein A n=1 Tax=Aeromicrobium flavum TaxID=416568 RepID=A0A512HQT6_9ACTN|nr:PspA/IM30 family protein [Aeromicrobium flavum]GEO87730.1 phage shock protein A [Aeromicrobium flavum]
MAEGGLWTRVVRLFRSRTASDGPDLEQVRERLDEAYRTQSRLLSQVRRGVADVATSRKRVEIQLASLRREIDTAGTEARAAVDRGDDGGARRALERQLALEKAATELDDRHAQLRSEEEQLLNSAAGIERQIEDFRIRKDTLSARYSAAQARNEIHGATSGIGATAGEVGRVMADAERHTRELEATADAVDELMNEGILARPGESQDEALLRRFDEALGSVDEPRGVEGDGHGPHQIPQ